MLAYAVSGTYSSDERLNMKQNILVIDSGGRGDATLWKLRKSPKVGDLFAARGTGGCKAHGYVNVDLDGAKDIERLARFAHINNCLTVVTSDDPLAAGIVDYFADDDLRIWGPRQQAAEIESSKVRAKARMRDYGIPTSPFKLGYTFRDALRKVTEHFSMTDEPWVLKKSGLALGKGALICETLEQAVEFLVDVIIKKKHGQRGNEIVMEDFLPGPELSLHAIARWSRQRGVEFKLFPTARDHKLSGEGDTGDQTGGMGVVTPVSVDEAVARICEEIVRKILEVLAEDGMPFTGCLYPGLKLTLDGPKVLEFNARPGDPEWQVHMMRLKSDLLDLILWSMGEIEDVKLEWDPRPAACVIVASGGYPGEYKKDGYPYPILGIEDAEEIPDTVVFHAGTRWEGEKLVTNGGRVAGVTSLGSDLKDAIDKAKRGAGLIKFGGAWFRPDIWASTLSAMGTP